MTRQQLRLATGLTEVMYILAFLEYNVTPALRSNFSTITTEMNLKTDKGRTIMEKTRTLDECIITFSYSTSCA